MIQLFIKIKTNELFIENGLVVLTVVNSWILLKLTLNFILV